MTTAVGCIDDHSVTGWDIAVSVCLATDSGTKIRLFRQWSAANCAALPTANAVQCGTVNRCCCGFACKWRYINVKIFNALLYTGDCVEPWLPDCSVILVSDVTSRTWRRNFTLPQQINTKTQL